MLTTKLTKPRFLKFRLKLTTLRLKLTKLIDLVLVLIDAIQFHLGKWNKRAPVQTLKLTHLVELFVHEA